MNQNLKISIAVLAGFTVGLLIGRNLSKQEEKTTKKDEELPKEKQQFKSTESTSDSPPVNDDSFPLQLGSKGHRVERLQIFLMRNLGWIRKPNGLFDLTTQARCQKFFKIDNISKALYNQNMMDNMVHDQRKKKSA